MPTHKSLLVATASCSNFSIVMLRKHLIDACDQELDHARREVDQLDASSALHHGAMSQLSQDSLN